MIDKNFITNFLASPTNHHFHAESVEIAKAIERVTTDQYPDKVVGIARPNEEKKHKEYRKLVYECIIKPDYNRIITTLKKIHRSEDWSIAFDEEDNKNVEELKKYTTKKFPFFGSIENWFFSFALKKFIDDPNAVCLVYPINFEKLVNSSSEDVDIKPYAHIFPSDKVLWFDKERLIIESDEKSKVDVNGKVQEAGRVYIFVDSEEFVYVKQKGKIQDGDYEIIRVKHDIGEIPAMKLGGIAKRLKDESILWESIITPCLGHWRESLRRYSDHQVNIVNHVHPEKWIYTNVKCPKCEGKKTIGQGKERENCKTCDGAGYIHKSTPFGVIQVAPMKTGLNDSGDNMPMPPAGYISKPFDNVDYIKKDSNESRIDALKSINLEFLSYEPTLNSGVAKDFDRQEIDSFIADIAKWIINNIISPVFRYTNEWRYHHISDREKNLPKISIPKKFNLLSTEILRDRAKFLSENNFSPFIVHAAQMEYYRQEYGDDGIEYQVFRESTDLDPLFGMKASEKSDVLLSGGCLKEDFIVSSKIYSFIKRAYMKDNKFFDKNREDKLKTLYDFAKEDITKVNAQKIGIDDE